MSEVITRHGYAGSKTDPSERDSSLFIINGYGQGSRSIVYRDQLISRFGGDE